jgi:hypothetical protein
MVLFVLSGHRRNPAAQARLRPLRARTHPPCELLLPSNLFPFSFLWCSIRSASDSIRQPWLTSARARACASAASSKSPDSPPAVAPPPTPVRPRHLPGRPPPRRWLQLQLRSLLCMSYVCTKLHSIAHASVWQFDYTSLMIYSLGFYFNHIRSVDHRDPPPRLCT